MLPLLFACHSLPPDVLRSDIIPADAVKQGPQTDDYPPALNPDFQGEFEDPVPVAGGVNTAGGEDSPFVTPDGSELFFFFTPDTSKSAEEQLGDGATGIWRSEWDGSAWAEAERVWLSWDGDVVLDGCGTVTRDSIWFCSARVDNDEGVDWWVADRVEGREFENWRLADRDLIRFEAGELHVSWDEQTVTFGSGRDGGAGGQDLWLVRRREGGWTDPENIGSPPNSTRDEWYPWMNGDETEVWYLDNSQRGYTGPALYRSRYGDGAWSEPDEIVSNFAGEPTLDDDGNLYFVHHFLPAGDSTILEADIYVAYRK